MGSEKLLNHVTARLTDDELEAAVLAAAQLGTSKSELVRLGLKEITVRVLGLRSLEKV